MPDHPLADPRDPARYRHPYDAIEDPYAFERIAPRATPAALLGLGVVAIAALSWAGHKLAARRQG